MKTARYYQLVSIPLAASPIMIRGSHHFTIALVRSVVNT